MNLFLSILIWILTGLFFLAGLLGSVLPSVPGPPLVFLGALLYSLFHGFVPVGWLTLLVLAVVAALSQVLDYLASAYGVKKFGGSGWGIWGSVLGGILGLLFFNIPGMLIGLFAGAFLLEWWKGKKEILPSLKIGGGSLLGFMGGTLMKMIFTLFMLGVFAADLWR